MGADPDVMQVTLTLLPPSVLRIEADHIGAEPSAMQVTVRVVCVALGVVALGTGWCTRPCAEARARPRALAATHGGGAVEGIGQQLQRRLHRTATIQPLYL